VLLTFKTALNIVEAPITRATGGSQRSNYVSNVFVVDTNKQPLNTIHPGEEKHPKHGFKTGDIVKAIVPSHLKRAGTHVGRMSAKASGSFTIATRSGTVPDVGKNYCRKLQRADGYGYSQRCA